MELKQKCIKGKRSKVSLHFEDAFIDELLLFSYQVGLGVMALIKNNTPPKPQKKGWTQMIGGVIKGKNPFFFEIEYVYTDEEGLIYLDIMEISSDDYLDYINLNQYLK